MHTGLYRGANGTPSAKDLVAPRAHGHPDLALAPRLAARVPATPSTVGYHGGFIGCVATNVGPATQESGQWCHGVTASWCV